MSTTTGGGTRGPVPKRTDQRRRDPKGTWADGSGVTKARASRKVRRPPVHRSWHPIAKRWYTSLSTSGQVVFYEPSDWAQAYFVAEAMSRLLQTSKLSAQMFAAVDSATVRLMTTEADRRRLRIELEREKDASTTAAGEKAASVAVLDEYRDQLGG